jgi:3-hydroxyacyl-[acyl-carrier-protein] dehydratase
MTESNVTTTVLDINQIKEILPHRYPFLLIDRVVELSDNRVVAIKNVTADEPFFVGHFPSYPVMPGVLQIEAMAQAACLAILRIPGNEGRMAFFAGIDRAKFRRQVVPGDQLRIVVELTRLKARAAKCSARCYVGEELVVEADLTCMLGDGVGA